MSIIIYGPQGCGKTKNAEKLRRFFGMDEIVDDEGDPYPLTTDQVEEFKAGKILFLTPIDPKMNEYSTHSRRVISFKTAIQMMENPK